MSADRPSGARQGVDVEAFAAGVRRAHKASVSRALNLIENTRPDAAADVGGLLSALVNSEAPAAGHRIGITGPPGVGKSTLVAALARELRQRQRTVGVVAVDPSSVVSGGALLGDRARMAFDPSDEGLFVRSLATGGALGGLSHAANAAVEVLASAYECVIVETTGVGQTETQVTQVADTILLVVQPGSGDVLQFLKAGVMEIPDVLVVNKADHGSTARRAASDLKTAMATLEQVEAGRAIEVLLTSARDGVGIPELVDGLDRHRAGLSDAGVVAARREGRLAWGEQLFATLHGRHGVASLGGAEAIVAELDSAVSAGRSVPEAVAQLSARYLTARR